MKIARLIYAGNPFYPVSAALVLWGVDTLFETRDDARDLWALLGLLGAYITLLGAAAFAIVRIGRVWVDSRTILVVILLLLISLSVIFDETVVVDTALGGSLLFGGLAFSIAISQLLLVALRIRLPARFLLPFHLLLTLFFVYPVFVSRLLHDHLGSRAEWAIAAFPTVAAVVFATLLPAIRSGSEYAKRNGTPWPWPLFPWTIFVVLALGVVGRTFYLEVTFGPGGTTSTQLSPALFVPAILVLAWMLFETGVVEKITWLRRAALVLPLSAVAAFLLAPGPGTAGRELLHDIAAGIDSPLRIILVLAVMFYGWAWLRREPLAEAGFFIAGSTLAFIGPQSVDAATLVEPRADLLAFILALSFLRTLHGVASRSSFRIVAHSFFCLLLASWLLPDSELLVHPSLISLHAAVVVAMFVPVVARDEFAPTAYAIGSLALTTLFILSFSTLDWVFVGPPPWVDWAYPFACLALFAAAWWSTGLPVARFVFFLNVSFGAIAGITRATLFLLTIDWPAGLDRVALGLLFLVVGFLLSMAKAIRLRGRLQIRQEPADES